MLHVACKRRCALVAHDHATACQMFAAFALAFRRSWGMGSCWYEGLPDSLFPTSHVCSVFPSCLRQEASSYWNARKCQNMPAIRANPVSQELFGTVLDHSWPFLAHGMPQLYLYSNARNCVSLCFGPCSSVPGLGENDSERFRTVPASQVYLNPIVLRVLRLYYIDCVSSCWPTDNAAVWSAFFFRVWQVWNWKQKPSSHISEALSVSGARTCE